MSDTSASPFHAMGREELLRALEMFAKNWLAHDGCWFLAAEERIGMEAAIELDTVFPEAATFLEFVLQLICRPPIYFWQLSLSTTRSIALR